MVDKVSSFNDVETLIISIVCINFNKYKQLLFKMLWAETHYFKNEKK